MKTQLQAERDNVPSWGWWWFGGGGPGGIDTFGGATPQANGAEDTKNSAPSQYTTTNNQVAGVDEADFVKNDGTRIFVLSANKLYATQSWPADQLGVQGKLEIEGWPQEMFLNGANVVVFSSVWQKLPLQGDVTCNGLDCGFFFSNSTKVTVVDVSSLSNLRVTQEYYLPGNYQSGRKVGDSVRLVTTDGFHFPLAMQWWPDWKPEFNTDDNARKQAFNDLIAKNEVLIRDQKLSDWLPAASLTMSGTHMILPQSCTAFSKVNAPVRLGTITVSTLDLTKPGTLDRSSIIGESGQIYASEKNLYVATQHWWWWPAPGQKDTTYVHKFDISNPDKATYLASGKVDGHIVDQFSMDENAAGYFRMATTTGERVPDTMNPQNWWGTIKLTNHISVMTEDSGHLKVLGTSATISDGERITASRFLGDTAYVTTFQNTDPFVTFDLKDPTNPKKVGTLEIPGQSSYIHPIDTGHVMTIGTYQPPPDANGNVDWSARRLQLAIYDVSDLSNPQQTFSQLVGTAYSWSDAQFDHKAFNYFAAKGLLAIPFADWNYSYSGDQYWSAFTSDLRVFKVDPNAGFTPVGAVSMADMYQAEQYYNWIYYWMPNVRRSVMADDFVYSISDSGIRVANISNLSLPVATAKFDRYVVQ
jgi:uncharacterized secreted protein with C-terminal beta-propeller domain